MLVIITMNDCLFTLVIFLSVAVLCYFMTQYASHNTYEGYEKVERKLGPYKKARICDKLDYVMGTAGTVRDVSYTKNPYYSPWVNIVNEITDDFSPWLYGRSYNSPLYTRASTYDHLVNEKLSTT